MHTFPKCSRCNNNKIHICRYCLPSVARTILHSHIYWCVCPIQPTVPYARQIRPSNEYHLHLYATKTVNGINFKKLYSNRTHFEGAEERARPSDREGWQESRLSAPARAHRRCTDTQEYVPGMLKCDGIKRKTPPTRTVGDSREKRCMHMACARTIFTCTQIFFRLVHKILQYSAVC